MRLPSAHPDRGIALVLVMIIIVSLSLVAGGFVLAMKVETQLARHAQFEPDLEWMGRSGMELAKYVLAESLNNPNEPYDSLNQFWAGGEAGLMTNSPLEGLSLENYPLGRGAISVQIEDMERRFNINAADEQLLQQALIVTGLDAAEFGTIVGSIQDWVDPDDDTHIGGTESDFYESLDPPYSAKNGPIDDISELLLIRGITPELYWGGAISSSAGRRAASPIRSLNPEAVILPTVGLVQMFNAVSDLRINLNTAPVETLRMVPGMDENTAAAIVNFRAGPDGVDGTLDDTPFRTVGELGNVAGMDATLLALLSRYANVRSVTFRVEVVVRVGDLQRRYWGLIRRNNARDLPLLSFSWE